MIMIAIKDMEKPKDCKKCPLVGTEGNPKELLNPMMCVAIWATKHEIKHCIGGEVLDDCPLIEIEQSEDCVSRKAVIDYLHTNMAWYDENGSLADDSDKVRDITNLVNSIPPVKPTHGTCKTCKNKHGSCCNNSSHYLRKDGFCNYFERRE